MIATGPALPEYIYLAGFVALVAFGPLLLLYQSKAYQRKDRAIGGKFATAPSAWRWPLAFVLSANLAWACLAAFGPIWSCILAVMFVLLIASVRLLGASDDQSPLALFSIILAHLNIDFVRFLKTHNEAFLNGEKSGNYVPGVCNYYELMGDLITIASGPFWHFVPMTAGVSRKECHDKFHHTTVEYLDAKKGDNILEFGCGFGEIGRQVAKISGANVTGLTMADIEIVGGNERIKKAGLEDQCKMVQGNYHKMPFEACSFDKVFGIYTLKYSADLETAISEAARVLKPGGRLLSYEIIITDKFDSNDKLHKELVHNISYSTCMPPLWHAQAFREAAKKAGLVSKGETDLCAPAKEGAWYSCFEQTGVYYLLKSSLVSKLMRFGEAIHILPKSMTTFYETCILHPTTDFVEAGRLGIIDGALMLVWEKP